MCPAQAEGVRVLGQEGECWSSEVKGPEAPKEGSAVGREAHLHERLRGRSQTIERRLPAGPAVTPGSKVRYRNARSGSG